jgi:hypothetical protein
MPDSAGPACLAGSCRTSLASNDLCPPIIRASAPVHPAGKWLPLFIRALLIALWLETMQWSLPCGLAGYLDWTVQVARKKQSSRIGWVISGPA